MEGDHVPDEGPVAVLKMHAEELRKAVMNTDWETGWNSWDVILEMQEPIPSVMFAEVMTNVFRMCYGDHEANRIYLKRRLKLAESSAESDQKISAEANPLDLNEDDWVATAVNVIHDGIESKTIEDNKDALEDCFTKLLWVAKDRQDVDGANKINWAIEQHGLPLSITQPIMQELYREVYHTRGV